MLERMPLADPDLQSARDELDRVLASPGFTRNERLGRFLRFVVEKHLEGKGDEIKEYVLAIEVFGRSPDHDPKQDSIVRTEAGRLRARLGEYYLCDGKDDPVIIELPKGRYVPILRQSVARPEPRDLSTGRKRSRRRTWLVCGIAGVLLAAGRLDIPLLGQPGTLLERLAKAQGVRYIPEGFPDRRYRALVTKLGLAPAY